MCVHLGRVEGSDKGLCANASTQLESGRSLRVNCSRFTLQAGKLVPQFWKFSGGAKGDIQKLSTAIAFIEESYGRRPDQSGHLG